MIISTGLRNHLLGAGSLKDGLDGGVIRIYSGAVPADADASIGAATLLCTVSLNDTGSGITLDATPSGGVIQKDAGETWSGTPVATGVASFFRFSGTADAGALSTTEVRAQGTVGTVLTDMIVASTTFTASVLRQIDAFAIGMPAS